METRLNLFEQGQKAVSTLFGISGYLKKGPIEVCVKIQLRNN